MNTTQLLYCNVLCGESYEVSHGTKVTNWPLKSDDKSGQLCDSLVDDLDDPQDYYIHDDTRIYPMFLVHIATKDASKIFDQSGSRMTSCHECKYQFPKSSLHSSVSHRKCLRSHCYS